MLEDLKLKGIVWLANTLGDLCNRLNLIIAEKMITEVDFQPAESCDHGGRDEGCPHAIHAERCNVPVNGRACGCDRVTFRFGEAG